MSKVRTRADDLALGTFQVTGDKLIVSDPCYHRDTNGPRVLSNAASGAWAVTTAIHTEGRQRFNSKLEARLAPFPADDCTWRHVLWDATVDSAQMGVFDEACYPQDAERRDDDYQNRKSFYARACAATERVAGGGAIAEGIVVSSGYGDGRYPVFVAEDTQGRVVGVRVVFIDDDGDED